LDALHGLVHSAHHILDKVDPAYREEQERKERAQTAAAQVMKARMEENERRARTVAVY